MQERVRWQMNFSNVTRTSANNVDVKRRVQECSEIWDLTAIADVNP
jgi:hypothetical protein